MRAALLAVLIACGDNTLAPSAEPASGTRLKVQVNVFEGGVEHVIAGELFDAERGETCRVEQWSDGFFYCTPEAAPAVYADANCTVEVAHVAPGLAVPRYAAHQFFLDGGFRISRLHAIGEPVATPETTFVLRGSTCDEGPFGSEGMYFAFRDEITGLAQTGEVEVAIDDRLAVRVATSPDGMRLPITLRDRTLELDCVADAPNSAVAVCTPVAATDAVFFNDAACTVPVVAAPETPAIAAVTREGCTTYHAIGAPTSGPMFRLTPTCTPASAPDDALFRVGAALPLSFLPRERVPGARLEPIRTGIADRFLHDTELLTDCRPLTIAGITRCVPHAAITHAIYIDETCTTEGLVALVATRTCEPPVTFAIHFIADTFEVHPIAGPAPTVFEITTGDRCVPYAPPAGFATRALGPAIPADDFPAATVRL